MNIQSEIEFFSDLGLVDKARFISRLICEIAEEAKVGNGDGSDAVRYKFANEMNQRLARFTYQLLGEDQARPQDDVDRQPAELQRPPDRAEARRDPAFQQAGAELDPIAAARLRRNRPVDPLDADLEDHAWITHDVLLGNTSAAVNPTHTRPDLGAGTRTGGALFDARHVRDPRCKRKCAASAPPRDRGGKVGLIAAVMCKTPRLVDTKHLLDVELHALGERELLAVVDGVGGAAHIGLPGI